MVRLIGPLHQGTVDAFTPAQTNCTKSRKELWYGLTGINEAGLKAP